MAGGYFNSFFIDATKLDFGLVSAPNPSKHRLILTNNSTWTSASSKLDVLLTELPQGTAGYTRNTMSLSSNLITFDTTNRRVSVPDFLWEFTPAGTSIQWDGLAYLRNADATSGALITSVDPATNTITIAGHGRVAGDEVIISADDGGTLPGGIASQIYYVINPTTNTFQISAVLNGSAVDIQNAGASPLRCRYANGTLVAGYRESEPKTILAGAPHNFQLQVTQYNSAFSAGVAW